MRENGKIFFLLFIVSFALVVTCGGLCIYMADNDFYYMESHSVVERILYDRVMTKAREVRDYINRGDLEGAKVYCDSGNFDVEIWPYGQENEADNYIWSSFDNEQAVLNRSGYAWVSYALSFYNQDISSVTHHLFSLEESYLFCVYINMDFPLDDDLKAIGKLAITVYQGRYRLIWAAVLCMFVCMFCFVVLMRGAGYIKDKKGDEHREEIVPGILTKLPFDLLTLFFAGGAAACGYYIYGSAPYNSSALASPYFLSALPVGGMLLALLCALYFTDCAIRIKQGSLLRRTLVFMLLKGIRRGAVWVMKEVPTMMITVVIFSVICVLELSVGGFMLDYVAYSIKPAEAIGQTAFLWGAEKIVLFIMVLYVTYVCKKLLKAGRALAEGQEDYRVDTAGMFGDFRRHGENLNSIGQGISRAVAEQIKSERLKTELITNVSHDLKTPLTSIINYVELLCAEETENGKIEEYAEVLFRQSGRLKKLLEDLIEASKAATGSLEVNLEPCEAGVLLAQAVGEYLHRMEETGLELIVRQPEEPVRIMADGRHLWRVFDNLLSNICKYSREHSRVFLDIELKEGRVFIIFRNMSKYMLDVPPEELAERFVRGDKSRHMEGSGLGLSIAESLMELQGGRMEIVTDGDLFKVILSFEALA